MENAGNGISECLDFKIFWGSMPPDLPGDSHLWCSFPQPPTSFLRPATSKPTESTKDTLLEVDVVLEKEIYYHSKANISFLQCWTIIGTITSYCYNLPCWIELAVNNPLYKSVFVLW